MTSSEEKNSADPCICEKSRNQDSPRETRPSVGKSAMLMACGTMTSRLLGFIRDMMMAAYFSRTITDAWLVAFRLPNLFRRLFGEGALGVSFVPVFVPLITSNKSEDKEAAHQLVNGIFSILLCLLSTLVCLGIIFAEPIVMLLSPGEGFSSVPGKIETTTRFTRIMFVFILFICLYALLMSILNSHRRFWLPALAPALWNVSMISSAFLPFSGAKESGEVLAWAVVVGGFLQMIVLLPSVAKLGFIPRFTLNWNDHNVRHVMKSLGPSILGLSVMQITILVNTRFASYLPEGANSWIFWADRILELPLSLFAVSLGTALLPTLSEHWSKKEFARFHESSNFYIRSVLLLSIPSALGLWILAEPIVEVLFMRGKFTVNDLQNTSRVLQIYSLGVLTISSVRVLAPCFYAIKNTWYPAVCSLMALLCHITLVNILIEPYGLQGLVTSTVLSAGVNLVCLLIGYSLLIGKFDYSKLFRCLGSYLIISLPVYFVLQLYYLVIRFSGDYFLVKVAALALTILLSASTYFILAHLMKLEEIKPTSTAIISKMRKIYGVHKGS